MMLDGPSLVRFFAIVSPLPPLMKGTFGVVVALGAPIVAVRPERTADLLLPLLTLHLFSASSGFAGPARRGHYDLLLTRGDSRLVMALVHWGYSIAPGIVAWLAIALIETAATRGASRAALAGGTVAAMAVVSMQAWACTVALPRFSGAIGWLIAALAASVLWPFGPMGDPAAPVEARALAAFLNPATLLGRPLDAASAVEVMPAVLVAVVGLAAACAWIELADYPLEASQ